ncbi:MAG TPA: hypothetical protein VIT38_14055 [Allosphingosinicella sp.]
MAAVKRRINSTGRRRIPHQSISITLLPPRADGIPRAKAEIELDGHPFVDSAAIVLEAYQRMTTSMRFDCGTVGEPVVPETLLLADIDPAAPMLFRLKVVDNDEYPGRLLGAADRLRPDSDDSPEGRRSLFPIERCELHSEIWKVDIQEAGPTLLLNYNIPSLTAMIQKEPLIQGILLPAALRIVLDAIVQDPVSDDDDEVSWKVQWLRYCREELKVADDPAECADDDDRRAWVNHGVRAFCKSYRFIDEIKKSLGELL